MTFKVRSQFLIVVIVTAVSTVLTFYHISAENTHAAERSERASKNVKMAFDSLIRDTEHYYSFRSYITMRTDEVLNSMRERDTETLYRLISPRYAALTRENPDLIIMQFHAPDGHSILRMHRKSMFGDDIAARRPMLREVHQTHKEVSGFEGGVEGIAYRIIVPVFQKGTYIGALEFGVDTTYFIKMIKQNTGSDGVLMIHEAFMGAADSTRYKKGFGSYRYSTIRPGQRPLMELFFHNNPMMKPGNIRYNGKDYEINPLYLKDVRSRNTGVIICINDISGGYQNVIEMVTESMIITVLLIALFLGIFEYTFAFLVKKLNFQERYIHTILDSQKNIVIVTDGEKIIYANKAFFGYFGYLNLAEFRAEHSCICDYFETGESDEYLLPTINGLLWTEYLLRYDRLEHKVKMTIGGKSSIFTVNSEKMQYQDQIRHVVVFTDITRLNELATQDTLTQIANRFQFDKILMHSIGLSRRYGYPLSLMLIDIDYFKQVNDRYGHLVGDEVLKKMAHLLSQNIRRSDIVARWGGEEFVVLLPECALSAAVTLAEMLRARIEEENFAPVDRIMCSIGVVEWREDESPDGLLQRVDEKLYEAKAGGRNRVIS